MAQPLDPDRWNPFPDRKPPVRSAHEWGVTERPTIGRPTTEQVPEPQTTEPPALECGRGEVSTGESGTSAGRPSEPRVDQMEHRPVSTGGDRHDLVARGSADRVTVGELLRWSSHEDVELTAGAAASLVGQIAGAASVTGGPANAPHAEGSPAFNDTSSGGSGSLCTPDLQSTESRPTDSRATDLRSKDLMALTVTTAGHVDLSSSLATSSEAVVELLRMAIVGVAIEPALARIMLAKPVPDLKRIASVLDDVAHRGDLADLVVRASEGYCGEGIPRGDFLAESEAPPLAATVPSPVGKRNRAESEVPQGAERLGGHATRLGGRTVTRGGPAPGGRKSRLRDTGRGVESSLLEDSERGGSATRADVGHRQSSGRDRLSGPGGLGRLSRRTSKPDTDGRLVSALVDRPVRFIAAVAVAALGVVGFFAFLSAGASASPSAPQVVAQTPRSDAEGQVGIPPTSVGSAEAASIAEGEDGVDREPASQARAGEPDAPNAAAAQSGASPVVSAPAGGATSAAAPTSWAAVVAALDRRRHQALVDGDAAAVATVSQPGSASAARDAELLAQLSALNARAEGMKSVIISSELVSHEGSHAVVEVRDKLTAYRIVRADSGAVLERRPGRGPMTWRVTLEFSGGAWRLRDSVAVDPPG